MSRRLPVLAGEDELTRADFTVRPDGSVAINESFERVSEGLYGGDTRWYDADGVIYAIDPTYGESVKLLAPSDYAELSGELPADGFIGVASAEIHGDFAYVRLTRNLRDPSGDIGWREGYTLDNGALLRVSLTDGSVETLYTYA